MSAMLIADVRVWQCNRMCERPIRELQASDENRLVEHLYLVISSSILVEVDVKLIYHDMIMWHTLAFFQECYSWHYPVMWVCGDTGLFLTHL